MSDIGALKLEDVDKLEDQSNIDLVPLDEDWFVTKWLQFHDEGNAIKGGKTRKYSVYNRTSKILLGYVKWKGGWRQYSFYPLSETQFDGQCLRDIADFCYLMTVNHKMPAMLKNAKKRMANWRKMRIKQLTERKKRGNLGLEVKNEVKEEILPLD
jgi:hypothetical protein